MQFPMLIKTDRPSRSEAGQRSGDPDGTPKLLDFGIAKILDAPAVNGSEPPMTMVRMGTPAYSSPEQILGEPVGVATDVYSLGIILYELLAGKRPYRLDSLGWEESARVVCERDATRPSSVISSKVNNLEETEQISFARGTTVEGLRKRLAGDLDNIVSVALRKEPARRYRSVDRLSEEIQNHLEGRPVQARGDSIVYKTSKLIGRHKLALPSSRPGKRTGWRFAWTRTGNSPRRFSSMCMKPSLNCPVRPRSVKRSSPNLWSI